MTITNCLIGIRAELDGKLAHNYLNYLDLFDNDIYNCTIGFDLTSCNNTSIVGNIINEGKNKPCGLDSVRVSDAIYLTNCYNYIMAYNVINKIASVYQGSIIKINCCIHLYNCKESASICANELYNSTYAIGFTDTKGVIDEQELRYNNHIHTDLPIGRDIPP